MAALTNPPATPQSRLELLPPVIIACLAGVLLFWGLGERYLWQDEAATAVLSERLVRFGRPLAYDGINLVTIDTFGAKDIPFLDQASKSPTGTLDYLKKRGDFKADTAWKWHPWGQFVLAGISLRLLGHTTVAARLPFALCALAAVLIFYFLVRNTCDHRSLAAMACLLLVFNTNWVLHNRQCRYYAPSGLLLLLTLWGYLRWQQNRRWGEASFLVSAWCWFQMDYGTIWPVLAVLFADALVAGRRAPWRVWRVAGILALGLMPFIYYYEMLGRLVEGQGNWVRRFSENLVNINEYVVPGIVLVTAFVFIAARWKKLGGMERRLALISCSILLLLLFWVPTVAPGAFVRYVVAAIPLGCFIGAWLAVRAGELWAPWVPWLAVMIMIVTPWLGLPVLALAKPAPWCQPGTIVRTDLPALFTHVFGHRPDPNRILVEWLKTNASPKDEILINYEDVPLMFYLPNPIRGGLLAFRVEDDSQGPPRFAIWRKSVPFGYEPPFQREVERYSWDPVELNAPDVTWGNNPDPMGQFLDMEKAPALLIAKRREK